RERGDQGDGEERDDAEREAFLDVAMADERLERGRELERRREVPLPGRRRQGAIAGAERLPRAHDRRRREDERGEGGAVKDARALAGASLGETECEEERADRGDGDERAGDVRERENRAELGEPGSARGGRALAKLERESDEPEQEAEAERERQEAELEEL